MRSLISTGIMLCVMIICAGPATAHELVPQLPADLGTDERHGFDHYRA